MAIVMKVVRFGFRIKLKASEYRGEQAEMNIQRLNVRIDQVPRSTPLGQPGQIEIQNF